MSSIHEILFRHQSFWELNMTQLNRQHDSALCKVFITDSHQIMREGLISLLEQEETLEIVGQAGSGGGTLMRIARNAPDVLILDISLPDWDGLEFCREIKKRFPGIRLVCLTHNASAHVISSALESGVLAYLLKQNSILELREALRWAAENKPYLSAEIRAIMDRHKQRSSQNASRSELNKREIEVIRYLANGLSTKDIARKFDKSPKTIDAYRRQILAKLKLDNLADLIKFAIKHNIIEI